MHNSNTLRVGRQSSFELHLVLWISMVFGFAMIALLIARVEIEIHIANDQRAELSRVGLMRSNAKTALHLLETASGAPCSPEFIDSLREVAFLPDGLNTFLYAPEGQVRCSSDGRVFDSPVDLGKPDIAAASPGRATWRLNRDLGNIRRPGSTGTIAQLGDFAVLIPAYSDLDTSRSWIKKELIARGKDDQLWSVAGEPGLHERIAGKGAQQLQSGLDTIVAMACAEETIFCVASSADIWAFAREWTRTIVATALIIALLTWFLSGAITSWLVRHWSLAERFKRRLGPKSIVLNYQPIVDARTGTVVAVEALARWRDVNGSLVPPDLFIPLVLQMNRTRAFTKMVVDRAYEELNRLPAREVPLQVNFNVFACDFESSVMLGLLEKFTASPKMTPAVELLEEQSIDLDDARRCIQSLARAGVPTLIDDFGTGYSNIARVAHLPVQAVKLDRSFAMAPADSILGRMLLQVIEMMRQSGRVIVVEGVENLIRFNLLRASGSVDLVQGYVVSRPLPIDELETFLAAGWHPAVGLQRSA